MKTFTFVVDDNLMILDDEPINFQVVKIWDNLNAIQWRGANGNIEFKLGADVYIDNVAIIQPYIDQFNAEKIRLNALEVQKALNV